MATDKRILVVEDDEQVRDLIRIALETQGYSVTTAEDGLSGYEKAVNLHPDLIITDVYMPAADGVHLIRHVRDTSEISATPILVTTGFGTGGATFSLTQGADAYEPKPINIQSLFDTVNRLLG
jgi:two-component system, OmpR family, response regulator MtrA